MPALAVIALSPVVHHPKVHHYKHHPECHTARCAHHADLLWAKHHKPKATTSGWVIPEYIVICESKGRNEPPAYSEGPAGYYQIIGPTWSSHHGSPPNDASQHSKAEQDRVAEDIRDTGGLSEWECA